MKIQPLTTDINQEQQYIKVRLQSDNSDSDTNIAYYVPITHIDCIYQSNGSPIMWITKITGTLIDDSTNEYSDIVVTYHTTNEPDKEQTFKIHAPAIQYEEL